MARKKGLRKKICICRGLTLDIGFFSPIWLIHYGPALPFKCTMQTVPALPAALPPSAHTHESACKPTRLVPWTRDHTSLLCTVRWVRCIHTTGVESKVLLKCDHSTASLELNVEARVGKLKLCRCNAEKVGFTHRKNVLLPVLFLLSFPPLNICLISCIFKALFHLLCK